MFYIAISLICLIFSRDIFLNMFVSSFLINLKVVAIWCYSNTDLLLCLIANFDKVLTSKAFVLAVWLTSWVNPEKIKQNFLNSSKKFFAIVLYAI